MVTFLGEIEQVPPMTSAVKKAEGDCTSSRVRPRDRRAGAAAGRIYEMHVIAVLAREMRHALVPGTRVLIDVVCSKGTYIRTLCHDIGTRRVAARTCRFSSAPRVGPFTLSESVTLEELEEAVGDGSVGARLLRPRAALEHLPRYRCPTSGARAPSTRTSRSGRHEPIARRRLSPFRGRTRVRWKRRRTRLCRRLDPTGGQCIVKPVRVL